MGTLFLPDYRDFIEDKLGITFTGLLEDAQVNREIQNAATKFSIDSPQIEALEITGDGTYRYNLPSDWEDNFSYITQIEYPPGEQVPKFLKTSAWNVFNNGTDTKIQLFTITPNSSDTFVVHYTTRHTITETTSTVPDAQFVPMGYLAAVYVAIACAGQSLRHREAKNNLDLSQTFRSKAQEYISQAKTFFQKYAELMGIPADGIKPADFMGDLDVKTPWGETNYLTHGNR